MVDKQKKCVKGYSCGSSCINVTYQCHKDFPEGVSVSINGFRGVVLANPQFIPNKDSDERSVENRNRPSMTHTNTPAKGLMGLETDLYEGNTNDGDSVSILFVDGGMNLDGYTGKSVNFTINDSHDYQNVSRISALQSARMLKQSFDAYTKNLQPGQLMVTTAYSGDGRGDYRKRAYERLGFTLQESRYQENDGTKLEGVWDGEKLVSREEWDGPLIGN